MDIATNNYNFQFQIGDFIKVLEPLDMNIKAQGKKIIFKTYALNQLKLVEMYDDNQQIIDKNDDQIYKKNDMEE